MITNYVDLQTALRDYLHRGDLNAIIPTFIQLAETRFNRNLRLRQMETEAEVVVVDGEVQLPDDWLEFAGSPMAGIAQLTFVPRDRWELNYEQYLGGDYYTIIGNTLRAAWDHSAGAGTVKFRYYRKIPSLSEDNPTNWMISEAPDAYLYGALLEAEPYIKNDRRIEVWRQLLQVALNDLQISNDRGKYSGGSLAIPSPLWG